MTIEPKDVLTVVAGAVSLSGLYYALKRNVEKLNITVRTMDTHHKREISAIHHRIDEIKIDTKETINKLDGKIDAIQQQNALISANIAELTGYLKAKQ
jgi:cell division protein FtsL